MKSLCSIVLIGLFSLTIASCSKNRSEQMWVAQISIIQEKSLTEIFKNIDVKTLRSANDSKNNFVGLIIQNSLANKIASFFFFKKNVDIRSKFINDQLGLITLGLLFTAREYQEAASLHTVQSSRVVMPPDPWTCFQAAVSTVIGLTQAQALWQSIVGGATVQTVVDALILIGRRVAGVISVGLMVVAVGDCLGWWN